MNKATQMHLENVTPKLFGEWKQDCFSSFASSHNGYHNVELGVNGFGKYTVRYREGKEYKKEVLPTRKKAIERYIQLITE